MWLRLERERYLICRGRQPHAHTGGHAPQWLERGDDFFFEIDAPRVLGVSAASFSSSDAYFIPMHALEPAAAFVHGVNAVGIRRGPRRRACLCAFPPRSRLCAFPPHR